MDVKVVYFEGCPNWRVARQRVDQALTTISDGSWTSLATSVVHLERVESETDSARMGLGGSPTILVDGRDLFPHPDPDPEASTASSGLSCRLYPTPEGLSGSPTVEQIVAALRERAEPVT